MYYRIGLLVYYLFRNLYVAKYKTSQIGDERRLFKSIFGVTLTSVQYLLCKLCLEEVYIFGEV